LPTLAVVGWLLSWSTWGCWGTSRFSKGRLVRLEPAGPKHLDGLWPLYSGGEEDPFVTLTREQARVGLVRAQAREDRADWAIVRREDDVVIGEAVLRDLDEEASSMSYRIALVGPEVFGRGYGTEATRLVRTSRSGRSGCIASLSR
jgi:hypothetical protein